MSYGDENIHERHYIIKPLKVKNYAIQSSITTYNNFILHKITNYVTIVVGEKMKHKKAIQAVLIAVVICNLASLGFAAENEWIRKEVDMRLGGGRSIRAINYPAEKQPLFLSEHKTAAAEEKILFGKEPAVQSQTAVIANVIDSPPIDGFVPWIAVAATDAAMDIYELDAIPATSVTGSYLTASPQTDYTIGLFDTGASTSIMNCDAAVQTGIYGAGLVTSSIVYLSGATSDAEAYVSHPLGIFIDGLGAIDANGTLNDSGMVGEENVAIVVGDPVSSPNLPTAIGAPMAVFFAAEFNNENPVSIVFDNNDYNAPDIHFRETTDPCIPFYPYKINLELRPSDVMVIQYFPCIEGIFECPDGDGSPIQPSLIVDALWTGQGLFFVSSVDLYDGIRSALDKDGFMFDTGAQVTVISEAVASRLELNTNSPEFTVEIVDVTGSNSLVPGFYLDSLEIAASPQWLSFTNVPVIVLDIGSPEGGVLDGIIGMNLFVDLNFVFYGGGLISYGQDQPFIRFDYIGCDITADIAPPGGDCRVDYYDLAAISDAWLATQSPPSANWNPDCDIAPDGNVNFSDLAILAQYWLQN